MNISLQLRALLSKIPIFRSHAAIHSRNTSALIRQSKIGQLIQLFQTINPKQNQSMIQLVAIQLTQAYEEQIDLELLKCSTVPDLNCTIGLCKQFSKMTVGITKWDQWIKACQQVIVFLNQPKKVQAMIPNQTQFYGCMKCLAKPSIKPTKGIQYSCFCQECQKKIQNKLSLAGMYIKSKYLLNTRGTSIITPQRLDQRFMQQTYFEQVKRAVDQVVGDQYLNWDTITSFYVLCLSPFATSVTAARDGVPPTLSYSRPYGSDVQVMLSANPGRTIYDHKNVFNLCSLRGQWKWRQQLASLKKNSVKFPQYQLTDSVKRFILVMISGISVPGARTSTHQPEQMNMTRPRKRQD